jgi:plastocyanin
MTTEPGDCTRVSPGMRRIAVLAAMAALTLAACGGSDNASTPTATDTPTAAGATSGGAKLAIAADPGGALKFTESTLTAKAGSVEVDFSNKSQLPHAVTIEGNGVDATTDTVTGQDAKPLTVDLKPGVYTFYCPVDGHRAGGMEGKLTVK